MQHMSNLFKKMHKSSKIALIFGYAMSLMLLIASSVLLILNTILPVNTFIFSVALQIANTSTNVLLLAVIGAVIMDYIFNR